MNDVTDRTLPELESRLTALTSKWMSLIGPEHHKDRDCHFYIERRWSYGAPPVWRAQHSGYWADALDVECATYKQAVERLIGFLTIEMAAAEATLGLSRSPEAE